MPQTTPSSLLVAGLAAVSVLLLSACGNSHAPTVAQGVPTVPVVPTPGVDPSLGRNRYAFNDSCIALQDNSSGKYVMSTASGYAASANELAMAEPFYFKPTLLGEYALMNRAGTLLNAAATVNSVDILSATDTASLRLLADGDNTAYPATPVYDVPLTKAAVDAYRGFVDPGFVSKVFTLSNAASGQRPAPHRQRQRRAHHERRRHSQPALPAGGRYRLRGLPGGARQHGR